MGRKQFLMFGLFFLFLELFYFISFFLCMPPASRTSNTPPTPRSFSRVKALFPTGLYTVYSEIIHVGEYHLL
jgi:hypothetical protein